MCGEAWCSNSAYALIEDSLAAVVQGVAPPLALCLGVATVFETTAALHVQADVAARRLRITAWPEGDGGAPFAALWEHLWRDHPRVVTRLAREDVPLCVSRDTDPQFWRGSVADLLLWELGRCDLAQLPLRHSGSQQQLLVLFRRRPFSMRELHVLRRVRRTLAALDRILDGFAERTAGRHGSEVQPSRGQRPVGGALTPREIEVLRLLAEGLLARSIAARLQVSPRTVHKHLGNVYRKLGAHDRLLAVRRAQGLGLLPTQRRSDDEG